MSWAQHMPRSKFPPPPATTDWQSPSPTAMRDPLQKVRQAIWGALPRGALAKLSQAGEIGLPQPLFTEQRCATQLVLMWPGPERASS